MDDLHQTKMSKKDSVQSARNRSITRKTTSRICCALSRGMMPQKSPDVSLGISQPLFGASDVDIDSNDSLSIRERDKRTRSVGARIPIGASIVSAGGKFEEWMDQDELGWVVGDYALVSIKNKFYMSSVIEIGGIGAQLRLRLHLIGYPNISDLWVPKEEWSYRLRPIYAEPGRKKGCCGRPGDKLTVRFFDLTEREFWQRAGFFPSATVVKSHTSHDVSEVEVVALSSNFICFVPNGMLCSSESFDEAISQVHQVRDESRRVIDAILAGAVEPCMDLGTRLLHGVHVISGKNVVSKCIDS